MSALIESYKKIDMKLSEFTSKIDSAEREIENLYQPFFLQILPSGSQRLRNRLLGSTIICRRSKNFRN